MPFPRPRPWLAGAAAALVLAAGALAAGTRLPSRPQSPPGTVIVTRTLHGGHWTLSLTAQWTGSKRPGHAGELGGLSAQFSACHRGWFLDLRQYCTALANPFFKVLGVTPQGTAIFRLTTRVVENNFAHGHRTGWIIPIDRRTATLYRLAAEDDLIVQLWAIDTTVGTPRKLGEIRG